jgi:hypothetical protein
MNPLRTLARRLVRPPAALLAVPIAALLAAGPALATPAQPGSKPSDEQVRKDIWRDGSGMLDFRTTAGKTGEYEWEARSQTWFFQRGFVVTRDAKLAEYPQARLEVGGLAVYRLTPAGWQFQKELTTFNRYTGIPAPTDDELVEIAVKGKDTVFRQDIRHMPSGLGSVTMSPTLLPRWQNLNVISYWVEAQYDYRVPSNGSVVPCRTQYEVRVFRNNPQSPWNNPVGTGRKVLQGCGAPGR